MLILLCLLSIAASLIQSQNPSPCPEIFSYEPHVQEEDRWFGVISFQTREDLDGVWLKITLDRPAKLLGNWFGEVVSSDNQEFTIKNSIYKVEAGPPFSVRFFVMHNLTTTIPALRSIKLNGKTICGTNEGDVMVTSYSTPQLYTSQTRASPASNLESNRPTTRPNNKPIIYNNSDSEFLNNRETVSQSNNNFKNEESRVSSSEGSENQKDLIGQQGPSSNLQRHKQTTIRNEVHTTERYRENEVPIHSNKNKTADRNSSTNDTDFVPSGDSGIRSPAFLQPATIPKEKIACGTVAIKANPLKVYSHHKTTHGNDSLNHPNTAVHIQNFRTVRQWPWHVALYFAAEPQLLKYVCGATLISENHILTAAHCVLKPQTSPQTTRFTVYLGKYRLTRYGTETQARGISEIFIHPQYNSSYYFNNIAVLKLKNPANITDYVRPCCLWEDDTDIDQVLNKIGTVVGWGYNEKLQTSDILLQGRMPVVSTVNCIFSFPSFFGKFTSSNTYCAGFRNGTTVCNGDSGGGMFFPKSAGAGGQNTVWQIRGIVSVAVAMEGQKTCDPTHYTIFTDVAKHLDWIKKVTDE